MPKSQRYTSEFKQGAVKLAQHSNESIATTAEELGIHYQTLNNLIKATMDKSPPKSKQLQHDYESLLAENAKLRRKLKHAEQEREILKKAAAHFAKEKDVAMITQLWNHFFTR